jgi:bifunctional NMN adenylyltransferase/nudix hydrolase
MGKKTCVVIGRFQPVHEGHLKLLRQGLTLGERVVVILGSHDASRGLRNPFTSQEREQMIRSCLTEDENSRVGFAAVRDYFYKDEFWTSEVRSKVGHLAGSDEITLLGNHRDFTTYYLKLFPEWKFADAEGASVTNATELRAHILGAKPLDQAKFLPPGARKWLETHFMGTKQCAALTQEYSDIEKYKKSWAAAPYAPTFVTVDSIVVHSGHVLLVRRKHSPGAGLLALPGGFLDPNERLSAAAIRELKEETCIDWPEELLKESIKGSFAFDHPLRSARGRTITHGFHFSLQGGNLPKVIANDDAAEVMWMPLLDLPKIENQFNEDHFHIISFFTRAY